MISDCELKLVTMPLLSNLFANHLFVHHPFAKFFAQPLLALCCQGAAESELPPALLGGELGSNAKTMSQMCPVSASELMGAGSKNRSLKRN